jgi:hypothetical protein
MSITNAALIEGALRDIGVIAETQPASPEQGATGIERLNQLMVSQAVAGIEIGYFAQRVADLTTACPIPPWAERGVRSWLALELLTVYPSTMVSPILQDDERNGIAIIRRVCVLQKLRPLDATILGAPGGRYDIITGTVI